MTDFRVSPDPVPTRRAATHEYILDMVQQLARLARGSGEMQIAILLEAVLAADKAATQAR